MSAKNYEVVAAHAARLAITGLATMLVHSAAIAEGNRYIVAYKAGNDANATAAVLRARGNVKLKINGANAMAVELPDASVSALRNDPSVAYVERDPVRSIPGFNTMSADDSAQSTNAAFNPAREANPASGKSYFPGQLVPYGITMVKADQLPSGASRTGNQKICIVDSGYDIYHEDLNNNGIVTGEADENAGSWFIDEMHHGTHVAGTISAQNNNGVGVVGVIPARQLHLHIVKVFSDKQPSIYSSTLIAGINKCAAAGANIISMSLGGGDSSQTEADAFAALERKGILLIAAAGNAGDATFSFPASYPSVVSVAAIDINKVPASFSQFNTKVELAGPGVHVLSTVPMGTGIESSASVGGTAYPVGDMTGSPTATATAPLFDFGIGGGINRAAAGKVCLIQRGSISFGAKVANCQASGGVAAIVYNSLGRGSFGGTLGITVTSIPSVTASSSDGALMKAQVGASATVTVKASNYAYFDGTSMATPHASAVAALVWSYFPSCSAAKIREALALSAEDLGTSGRDIHYGYGLVNAKAAYERLSATGCK